MPNDEQKTCQCGSKVDFADLCRKCWMRKWRSDNKERKQQYDINWRISHREYFRKTSANWTAEHKEQVSEYYKVWYSENKEKCSAKNNARRARISANGGCYTEKQEQELKAQFNNCCLSCGLNEVQLKELRRVLSLDHVVPIAQGGTNYISNLQPLCHGRNGCNNKKGIKSTDYRSSPHPNCLIHTIITDAEKPTT